MTFWLPQKRVNASVCCHKPTATEKKMFDYQPMSDWAVTEFEDQSMEKDYSNAYKAVVEYQGHPVLQVFHDGGENEKGTLAPFGIVDWPIGDRFLGELDAWWSDYSKSEPFDKLSLWVYWDYLVKPQGMSAQAFIQCHDDQIRIDEPFELFERIIKECAWPQDIPEKVFDDYPETGFRL